MPERRAAPRRAAARTLRERIRKARGVLLNWGRRNVAHSPWRSETDSFHALIAEILLQRTRAEQVVPVFTAFKRRFPRPIDLATASEESILRVIASLGLRWRARYLRQLGKELNN